MWYKKGTSGNDKKIYLLSSREPHDFLELPKDRGFDIYSEDAGLNTIIGITVQRKFRCSSGVYFGDLSGWNHITVVFTPKSLTIPPPKRKLLPINSLRNIMYRLCLHAKMLDK